MTCALAYNGVHAVLALACLIAIFLTPKYVSDKGSRILLIVAFVLIIIIAGVQPYCLKYLKLAPVIQLGEGFRKIEEGTFEKVLMLSNFGIFANLLEVLGLAFILTVARKAIKSAGGDQAGEGV